jgi:hypothetical protein
VELYQRGADKIYRQAPAEAEGICRSKVLPGFWLKVDWFWERPTLTEVIFVVVGGLALFSQLSEVLAS